MSSFNCTNCGDCCGPVPVSKQELGKIQKLIRNLPKKFEKIKEQKRDSLTCMFRDVENNTCSIYHARPEICKMFGLYEGMMCSNNPEHATKSKADGTKRLGKSFGSEGRPIGILTMDITWKNIKDV